MLIHLDPSLGIILMTVHMRAGLGHVQLFAAGITTSDPVIVSNHQHVCLYSLNTMKNLHTELLNRLQEGGAAMLTNTNGQSYSVCRFSRMFMYPLHNKYEKD